MKQDSYKRCKRKGMSRKSKEKNITSFVQTPQSQTSLSGLELNTNSLVENTYSDPPLRRRLFSNEMESQNLEPIEMMRTEIKKMTKMIKKMTKMMERMMEMMERMMIEGKEDRNLFKKCLRDTVRKPEIYQDSFGTP